MIIMLNYLFSKVVFCAVLGSISLTMTGEGIFAREGAAQLCYSQNSDRSIDQEHFVLLETFIKIIDLLRENKELKCSAEEKLLADRLLRSIKLSLGKRYASEKDNAEIAHKLRIVMQLFNISSPLLDSAQGNSVREETENIVRALQACLAERNITPFNRKFRSLVNTIEPYKTACVVAALPLLGFATYSLYGFTQRSFIRALPSPRTIGNKAFDGIKYEQQLDKRSPSVESWNLFCKALIFPAAGMIYKALESAVFKDALTKSSDKVKQIWARLQGLPARGSNPASSSKIALKDVPAPAAVKDHLQALARITVAQEAVFNQSGGVGLKALLLYGDTSLAQMLACGLADEIVRVGRENNVAISCPVAYIHASKLSTTPLKTLLDEITAYNKACVIVIQDIDWSTDSQTYSAIVAEIVNGMKAAGRLHEQYIVIGVARNLMNVDSLLQQPGTFSVRLMLSPQQDPSLLQACIERAEKLYGITISNPELRARLKSFICEHSFGDFMNLFSAAYTKSLPQIGLSQLNEEAIARELALVRVAPSFE